MFFLFFFFKSLISDGILRSCHLRNETNRLFVNACHNTGGLIDKKIAN